MNCESERRSYVIAVVNQKGGVGKTTTSINVAASMAAIYKKSLLIDLDPQGNASTGLGCSYKDRVNSIYQVLIGKISLQDVIRETIVPLLHVAPSTVDLSAAELEIVYNKKWQYTLKNSISSLCGDYSYIFIDCPPSLGVLSINALAAADSIIIPMQCEFFALEGLGNLLKTVDLIKKNLNPNLKIEGVVLTMHNRRKKLCHQVEKDVREHLGDLVYKTIIPRNIRISEASSHGKPAIVYDMQCSSSRAYLYLVKEILKRQLVTLQ